MADRTQAENAVNDVNSTVVSALPFIAGPERGGNPIGGGIVEAAAALKRWQDQQQRKAIESSRQTLEERRMSRGADEKGLSAFGQAVATTPDTVSWHPLTRAAAMLGEIDQTWPTIQRELGKATGLPTGPLPPPAQPLSQAMLRGKAAAEAERERMMSEMPSLPSASDVVQMVAGLPTRRKGPTATQTAARVAYNAAKDLGDVTMALPGLVAQTVLPRMKMPGETDEQAEARAAEEGRQMGRGVKQGLLGGTLDILEHPLESALTKPFTTAVTEGPVVRGLGNLTKAGAMKAGVPADRFASPIKAEVPVLNRALENLREGLLKHSGQLAEDITAEGAMGAGSAVYGAGRKLAGLVDWYLAKFADGFYSGDPRVTVMAERFARDKEMANSAARAAIGRLAGGAAKEMERGKPIAPEDLPGLPGQGPSSLGPGAPPAPVMTMPPKGTAAPAPTTATGTPVADIGAAAVPEPAAPTTALGPQAPLLDRAVHVMRDALKDHPNAEQYISEFKRRFNEGHLPVVEIAEGLVNSPEFVEQFKYKAMKDAEAKAPPSPPVREMEAKQRIYSAKDVPVDIAVERAPDVAAAERVEGFGPGVKLHVERVTDEFMRNNMLPPEARDAVREDVKLALQDAMGGENKTANWRGQMRGNPEQFAKDFLKAAEEKVGNRLTKKVRAQLLDTIDKRDKEGLEFVSIEKKPDGGYEVVRTTRIPHTPQVSGKVVELHPAELVPPKRLTATEVRKAVQAQLEETMNRHQGATEMGYHAKQESLRAIDQKKYGKVPEKMLDVANNLYQNAVVEDLVEGVSNRNDAIRQVAQAAHNMIEARRRGDVIPQVLPAGMRPSAVAEVIREYGKRIVDRKGLGAQEMKALGLDASEIPEELESEPVTGLAVAGQPEPPPEGPAMVDTTAKPTKEPAKRITPAEYKGLRDLSWEVLGFEPMDEAVGFGSKTTPAYSNKLLGDALKWHALSEKALKDNGAFGKLDKFMRSNMTNKSLQAGMNNFIPNISNVAMNRGVDPVSMMANGVDILQQVADWHGKDASHVSATNARAFDALDRAGLGMDFVQHQLGDRAMSPSQVLRSDPFFGWMRNPGTDLPHTRAAKWFYRFGDQVIRMQEGVEQFNDAIRDIEGLKDGEYFDLQPTRRQHVRITKQGDQYFVEDPYALTGEERKPTPITEKQLDQLVGKHAAHRSTRIVQDYPDQPQLAKMMTAYPQLSMVLSPFRSYQSGALDAPAKAGLVTNVMFRSPFAVSTNSKAALARAGARELKSLLIKSSIVNGIRSVLDKQGGHGVLASQFRGLPDEEQRMVMGAITNPRMIESIRMKDWANIGPTADMIGLLAAMTGKAESMREHELAKQGKLNRFSREVIAADTGEDFNTNDAVRLAMLSGGPIANILDAIKSDAKSHRSFNLEKLTTTIANSMVGGLNAGIARGVAGVLSDTGPGEHLRLPVGETRNLLAEMSGRQAETKNLTGEAEAPAYAMPLLSSFIKQIIGKAWQARDFNSMRPEEVNSVIHKMKLAMKESAELKEEESMREAARAAVLHAPKSDMSEQKKLELEELRGKLRVGDVIDRTVDEVWNDYVKTYKIVTGRARPKGSK